MGGKAVSPCKQAKLWRRGEEEADRRKENTKYMIEALKKENIQKDLQPVFLFFLG